MAFSSLPSRTSRFAHEKSEPIRQIVSFRIGQEDFGVDILQVQEVIRLPKVTPVPNSPGFIIGVVNLRGRIVPVIDLRQRLRIRGNRPDLDNRRSRVLIVDLQSLATGLIVDSVSEIIKVPISQVEPTPDLVVSSVDARYITGVVKLADRLVVLLDITRVLKPQEEVEYEQFHPDIFEDEPDEERSGPDEFLLKVRS